MLSGFLLTTNLYAKQLDLPGKIKYNDIKAVEALISEGADINQKDENTGYTALMWACEFNYTDMAKMLKIYYDAGFNGPVRPDHAPTLEGESNDNPGYAMVGKVLAIGYMRGIMEGAGIQFE